MSDNKLPDGFSPVSPDSDFGKMMEKFKGIDLSKMAVQQLDYSHISRHVEKQNRETNAMLDGIAEERARKDAAEEAYRLETIRSLHAIEQNTANLYALVDLISKSNEQQDELIAIIADILTIAKAKDKKEAESIYKNVMGKITQTVKDGETLAKLVGWATAVYELAKPIIENLKV